MRYGIDFFVYLHISNINLEKIKVNTIEDEITRKLHSLIDTQKSHLVPFRRRVRVLYWSINSNSSRRNYCAKTVKLSNEKESWCISISCMDNADLSYLVTTLNEVLCMTTCMTNHVTLGYRPHQGQS